MPIRDEETSVNERHTTTSNADLIDRLARLRAVLPLMAGDLATARRRATALALENDRLTRRVLDLEARLTVSSQPDPPAPRRPARSAGARAAERGRPLGALPGR